MKLPTLFRRRAPEGPPVKGFTVSWLNEGSSRSEAQLQRLASERVGAGNTSSLLMACLLWASRRMGESPVGLRHGDDEDLDFESPLAELISYPCPYYTWPLTAMALTCDYLADGNAYLVKGRNNVDGVLQLLWVPSWTMDPHAPDNGNDFIDYYSYRPMTTVRAAGSEIRLAPSDVIHFRYGIDPYNVRKGRSLLKILLSELYTDMEGVSFTATLLKNAGIVGTVLSPAGSDVEFVGPDQKPEDVKKAIKAEFTGAKRGDVMIMLSPTKVDYIGVNAEKMDLSKLREIPEERVTALLGIPAAVVGFGTGLQQTKVGATMSEMRAMAYEDCIIPMQRQFADVLRDSLIPDFYGDRTHKVVFDNSGVRALMEDENKRSDRYLRQFSAGAITRAAFLRATGQEWEDGDEVFYIGLGVTIVPKAAADGSDYGADDQPAEQPDTEGEAQPDATEDQLDQGDGQQKSVTRKVSRADVAFLRAMEKLFLRLSARWANHLAKQFRELGHEAAVAFRDVVPGKALDDEVYVEEIMRRMDFGHLSYSEQYLEIARRTIATLNAAYGLNVMLSNAAEQRVIAMGGTRRGLVDLEAQTRKRLMEVLEEMRAEGAGAPEIAARIEEMVAAGPWASAETRAQVIARTETKYAQNYATLEAYEESDSITGLVVIDGQLPTSDDECIARNGTRVDFEEAQQLMNEEHPNGTLSFVPDVQKSATRIAGYGGNGKPLRRAVTESRREVVIRRDENGRMIGAEIMEVS